jgi:hypothetical protein
MSSSFLASTLVSSLSFSPNIFTLPPRRPSRALLLLLLLLLVPSSLPPPPPPCPLLASSAFVLNPAPFAYTLLAPLRPPRAPSFAAALLLFLLLLLALPTTPPVEILVYSALFSLRLDSENQRVVYTARVFRPESARRFPVRAPRGTDVSDVIVNAYAYTRCDNSASISPLARLQRGATRKAPAARRNLFLSRAIRPQIHRLVVMSRAIGTT